MRSMGFLGQFSTDYAMGNGSYGKTHEFSGQQRLEFIRPDCGGSARKQSRVEQKNPGNVGP